jgi:pilus assembly protein Flp/PilA
MNYLVKKVHEFMSDEQGATAVEYGLMAALIAAVIVIAVTAIGNNLNTVFNSIKDRLVVPAAPPA